MTTLKEKTKEIENLKNTVRTHSYCDQLFKLSCVSIGNICSFGEFEFIFLLQLFVY